MTNTELIQHISKAFSEVTFPGNDQLVESSYGDEPVLVKDHFKDRTDWKTLDREFLDFDGALSFLSNKALHFYIAAFMIADINEPLDFNDPSIRLCWALTPQSENKKIAQAFGSRTIGERAKKSFDAFTSEQASAVVAYLRWKLLHDENNYTIIQALDHYWLKRIKA